MKTKIIILITLAFIGLSNLNAQVGIGTTTPDASAELDLSANDKGFLPPRMTTAQREAIASPADGLTIYNTTIKCLETWNGTGWINLCDGSIIGPPITSGACAGEPSVFTFNGLQYSPVESAGQCWLDRNLGAIQVASGSTDISSYGDLYQWGRATEGHEKRTSLTTGNLATTPTPNTGNSWDGLFITNGLTSPFDWLTSNNNSLWQGLNGINNPCPSGYKIPTPAEWDTQRASWSSNDASGAIGSALNLSLAGRRIDDTGDIEFENVLGYYWTSGNPAPDALVLYFNTNNNSGGNIFAVRALGASVRCIKD
jgi:uncharacterized protein (TIGR02145 family)